MSDSPVLVDFESRSRVKLKVGGRKYWEHPSSEVLCAVWYDVSDGSFGLWHPGEDWPHQGRVLAAHNAIGFDRFAAERYGIRALEWIDTSSLARKAGLPGALDALGVRWCGTPKDHEASKFTRSLSSVKRPPKSHLNYISAKVWSGYTDEEKADKGVLPEIDQSVLDRVESYCAKDVMILVSAWPRLSEWQEVDRSAERLDRAMNDRGIRFDSDLASVLLKEDERLSLEAVTKASDLLGISPIDCLEKAVSPKQFCEYTGAPDARRSTTKYMDHPLAAVRRSVTRVTRGKLVAGLASVHDDGRLRDACRYYGAHTGRWSGKGMQLHNLTRPGEEYDGVDPDPFAEEVLRGRPCTEGDLVFLLRPTITATPGGRLVVGDFSAIEAVGLAWAAGDEPALAVFGSDRDSYKVTASGLYETPYEDVTRSQRQVAKVCDLSLGYQGAAGAFSSMAENYSLDTSGIDIPGFVKTWRKNRKPVVNFWHQCLRAFRSAAAGVPAWAGPFEYVPGEHGEVACFLPSGRPIVYNDVHVEGRSATYLGTKSEQRLYGGKLVENAIQGMCRDLLVHALILSDYEGINPVLTVHDEIVCDTPRSDAAVILTECMTDVPAWAEGFPLKAKVWEGFRYRK